MFRSPLLALVLITLAGTGAVAAPAPPNILFILTDDQRADSLGAAGNPIVITPNLDALAAQGVRFRNSFTTTPVCFASRASILTGQHTRRHRITDFDTPLSPAALAASYPLLLRQAGYYTGFIGKWGLGGALPEAAFDEWAGFAGQGSYFEPGEPEHLTRRQGHRAAAFVRSAREPFLLTVAFKAPHVQDGGCSCTMPPDPADATLYDGITIPKPATATPAAFAVLPRFLRESEGRLRWFDQFGAPELDQQWRKDYYRLITGMDRAVGEILAALDERGLRERTLIVFTSDNGLLASEHGLTGKWLMFEESIRTPLAIVWPGLAAARRGARVDAIALDVDLAPTLLDAAHVAAPNAMQGRSLRPLVTGRARAIRKDAYFEHPALEQFPAIPANDGVRGTRYKYVRYPGQTPVYEQLFDVRSDPGDSHDILHTPALLERRPQFYRRLLERLRARAAALRDALE